jgi:hypothetical protein
MNIVGKTFSREIEGVISAPRKLHELMSEFEIIRDANLARKKISKVSRQEYRLEHMEERNDYWVLLINIIDPEAADPVTQKIDGTEGDRKVMELGEDRGLESSSHMIIFKEQNEAKKHLVLYEYCSALPFYKAISFLNHLCRVTQKHHGEAYDYPHPDGIESKKIKKYCWLSLHAHPSNEFRRELETGVINGIKITSDMNVVRGYDSKSHSELIGTEIKMDVGRLAILRSGGNWEHLKKALQHANSLDSPFVRISFTDLTGASHTTILSSDTGDLVDADKYVKKSKIQGFDSSLRTAFPIIHEGIRDRMLGLIQ